MKHNIIYILVSILASVFLYSCEDSFDVKNDDDFNPDQIFVNHERLKKVGMAAYSYVPKGFNETAGAFLAGLCDEAEHTSLTADIQKFNLGAWDQFSNPDNRWAHFYQGIYYANYFLEKSVNYKEICLQDTITQNGKNQYAENIKDIEWMRAEVRFLRAYYHFELFKRYGEIPIVEKVMTVSESRQVPRFSTDSVISFIVNECDLTKNEMNPDWSLDGKQTEMGRATKGTAIALKSRALLYAASPLYNPTNDLEKWKKAAAAAHELIAMDTYQLHDQYRRLFGATATTGFSKEVIFYRMHTAGNAIEIANYPIGTDKGQSGTCPSQNLIDAYEMKSTGEKFDWNNPAHAAAPYTDRDPRMASTVVYNGATWNGRAIETYVGGIDGLGKKEASKTGYYLKKYIVDELNLTIGQTSLHTWILFRYGEILLNYAEAMNEAYGPDGDPEGYGKTARSAINEIRGAEGKRRIDVRMPAITSTVASTKEEFRDRLKNERRVELAFEEHRMWDVRRWSTMQDYAQAQEGLGSKIRGIRIVKDGSTYTYTPFDVEKRSFDKKMLQYPVPQTEIVKYENGFFTQNQGW